MADNEGACGSRELPPVGLLVGGGALPVEIAAALDAQGRELVIVAIEGAADKAILARPETVSRSFGQIGGIVRDFTFAGVRELVIAGAVKRPDLRRIRVDTGFFPALFTVAKLIKAGGDDALLRAIVGFFENQGLRVVGPGEVVPQLLAADGVIAGGHDLSASQQALAKQAFALLHALSPFDVGQGVVVSDLGFEAIEGAEGTDRMLERVEARRSAIGTDAPAVGGLLVKAPKVGQDLRVDMPVIGPLTVDNAARAGLAGIALQASRVLVVERQSVAQKAETTGVVVFGLNAEKMAQARGEASRAPHSSFSVLGRRSPTQRQIGDIEKCVAVWRALQPFDAGHVVVAHRRHVLAVSAADALDDVLSRVVNLRQWGRARWSKRAGVIWLAREEDLTPERVAGIADAGLAGFAFLSDKSSPNRDAITRSAAGHKLFAVAWASEQLVDG